MTELTKAEFQQILKNGPPKAGKTQAEKKVDEYQAAALTGTWSKKMVPSAPPAPHVQQLKQQQLEKQLNQMQAITKAINAGLVEGYPEANAYWAGPLLFDGSKSNAKLFINDALGWKLKGASYQDIATLAGLKPSDVSNAKAGIASLEKTYAVAIALMAISLKQEYVPVLWSTMQAQLVLVKQELAKLKQQEEDADLQQQEEKEAEEGASQPPTHNFKQEQNYCDKCQASGLNITHWLAGDECEDCGLSISSHAYYPNSAHTSHVVSAVGTKCLVCGWQVPYSLTKAIQKYHNQTSHEAPLTEHNPTGQLCSAFGCSGVIHIGAITTCSTCGVKLGTHQYFPDQPHTHVTSSQKQHTVCILCNAHLGSETQEEEDVPFPGDCLHNFVVGKCVFCGEHDSLHEEQEQEVEEEVEEEAKAQEEKPKYTKNEPYTISPPKKQAKPHNFQNSDCGSCDVIHWLDGQACTVCGLGLTNHPFLNDLYHKCVVKDVVYPTTSTVCLACGQDTMQGQPAKEPVKEPVKEPAQELAAFGTLNPELVAGLLQLNEKLDALEAKLKVMMGNVNKSCIQNITITAKLNELEKKMELSLSQMSQCDWKLNSITSFVESIYKNQK